MIFLLSKFKIKWKQKQKQDIKQQGSALQNEIVINRVFNLPVSVVWLAWTDAEYFKKWWGPRGFTCPSSKMEAKVGGKYLSCMRGPDGKEYWSTGEVKEFIPERKLVVTDSFSDEKGNIKSASEYGMPGDWPKELLITCVFRRSRWCNKIETQAPGYTR